MEREAAGREGGVNHGSHVTSQGGKGSHFSNQPRRAVHLPNEVTGLLSVQSSACTESGKRVLFCISTSSIRGMDLQRQRVNSDDEDRCRGGDSPVNVTAESARRKQQHTVKRPVRQEVDSGDDDESKRVKYESDGGGSPISMTLSGGELIRRRSSSPSSSTNPTTNIHSHGGVYFSAGGGGPKQQLDAPRPTAVVPPANNPAGGSGTLKCARCRNHKNHGQGEGAQAVLPLPELQVQQLHTHRRAAEGDGPTGGPEEGPGPG
ncbi:hypothetical protein CEXT_313621 [Caerostris extrusa]|uniref:Uncharacterized protein n=1 Tax=Caerostris extrusa TaxID=172846 RepID=A0AAV4N1W1_CAEEX|nr:hypothetical protein CEXT_313621 [Caerostris extrusa]